MDIFLILNGLIIIIGIAYSIILHEVAHGFAALIYGDDTAKLAGRLSLNPLKHIDPVGTVILPLILFIFNMPVFGWAKPVPINPINFKHQRIGILVVSIAGVVINFIIMILMFWFFVLFRIEGFLVVASMNLMLFVFNLLPFPPLDGYNFFSMLLPEKIRYVVYKLKDFFLVAFLVLMVTGGIRYIYVPLFNLIGNFLINLFLGGKQ
ncbi:MAG: site-2 protease family protein [Brevinematales bacterium]|nr:site-2 protease family protein [Brevinematales bacterium]